MSLLLAAITAWLLAAPGAGRCGDSAEARFTTIAGDLPGIVFAGDRPYLVVDDIYVPQGKTVSIEAGAVFLFKNFTGLQVLGTLIARGEQDKPIVFTSVNDREYNARGDVEAAPFDWNGVFLHEDALGSDLRYCAVMYSVEGVSAQTRVFRLDPVIFLQNGRASLTIEGERKEVPDGPYEYALSRDDPALERIPADILRDPLARRRGILRYGGVALTVAGATVAIASGAALPAANRRLDQLSARDYENLAYNSSADWNHAHAQRARSLAGLVVGAALAAAGAVGVGWTFTF
jgi:hypothetical protein